MSHPRLATDHAAYREERARIVAWLRGRATGEHGAIVEALAAAIQRGEHADAP